jgi:hypothetical protein
VHSAGTGGDGASLSDGPSSDQELPGSIAGSGLSHVWCGADNRPPLSFASQDDKSFNSRITKSAEQLPQADRRRLTNCRDICSDVRRNTVFDIEFKIAVPQVPKADDFSRLSNAVAG